MASLAAQAPDGATLNIDVPPGTDPAQYDGMVDEAVAHYTATRQGPVESAARGALRNFPLGQQVAAAAAPALNALGLADKGDYSSELQHLTDAAEEGKAQNPKSYGAGAVAGTFAPLALPGVGEALEAAPVLGNAALGAVQSAADANLTRPTRADLGNAALSAGLGGALGAVSKGLSAVAPTAEEMAANSTAHGFGATARNIGKVMGDDPNVQLKELGEWANAATTPEGEPLVALASRPGKMLKALNAIHDAAGEQIGGVIDQMSDKLPVSTSYLKQELAPILEDVADINPAAETKVAGVLKRLDKLEETGRLDFQSLQKLKSAIGKNIGDEPAMQRAYGVFADYMDKMIDNYGKYIKDPALYESFDGARVDYRNASRLLPILRRAEGRELAQGPAGNGGLLGLFGMASGVAAGHPALGAVAMPANAVARPVANMVGRNAALKAVPQMGKIAAGGKLLNQGTALELANYLQSKFGEERNP